MKGDPQLGSMDLSVERGGKGRRAKRGAWIGASQHFLCQFSTLSTAWWVTGLKCSEEPKALGNTSWGGQG